MIEYVSMKIILAKKSIYLNAMIMNLGWEKSIVTGLKWLVIKDVH